MAIESELKLTLPLSDLNQVRKQRWLQELSAGPAKREKLISVYFDTNTCKLRNHGISLRIRKVGRKRLQTIKVTSGVSNGAFGRREWEAGIRDETPNYRLAKNTALASLLTPKLKRALHPVFETKIERTVLPVRVGNSLIEVALDRGLIQTNKHRERVSEIELELKSGIPADIARLGRRFLHKLPVAYGAQAKADRGYALSVSVRGSPVEAGNIDLSPNMSAADAFTIIGLGCLGHLASNEQAVLHGFPEGIHQMRVGLRRLRAAISVFKDFVRGAETERIKIELSWLTKKLGPARDFDVLMAEGIAPLQKANPRNPEVTVLKADLIKQRESEFVKTKSAVKSDRYRKLILTTALWLADGKWLRNNDPLVAAQRDRKICDYAAEILESRTKKVARKVETLQALNARQLHKLRIATKKLRYAAEFFDCIFYKEKRAASRKSFENSLKSLQDALGALNDVAVHTKLTRKYVHRGFREHMRQDKAFATGLLTGREQMKAESCKAAAIESGNQLIIPRYWRK